MKKVGATQGGLVAIKESSRSRLTWKIALVLKEYPQPKRVVRQTRTKTSARVNVHRAVHQLIPLLKEEQKELPSEEQLDLNEQPPEGFQVPHQPRTQARTGAQQLSLSHVAMLLRMCLLACQVHAGSVEPVLESKMITILYHSHLCGFHVGLANYHTAGREVFQDSRGISRLSEQDYPHPYSLSDPPTAT